MIWAREGGATTERMNDDIQGNSSMSASQKDAQRKLVADVYRQRGTADQVRTRIESECMAEKEEKAKSKLLAEALLKAGVKPGFDGAAPAGAQPAQSAVASQGSSSNSAQSSNADICRSYANQQENIQRSQRAGGSASKMDSLRRQLEDVRRNMSQARC